MRAAVKNLSHVVEEKLIFLFLFSFICAKMRVVAGMPRRAIRECGILRGPTLRPGTIVHTSNFDLLCCQKHHQLCHSERSAKHEVEES